MITRFTQIKNEKLNQRNKGCFYGKEIREIHQSLPTGQAGVQISDSDRRRNRNEVYYSTAINLMMKPRCVASIHILTMGFNPLKKKDTKYENHRFGTYNYHLIKICPVPAYRTDRPPKTGILVFLSAGRHGIFLNL